MKRSTFWIVALVAVLAVLTASLLPTLEKVVEAEEPVTIKFFSHRFTEVPYGDILRKQVQEYEELNPNIKVEMLDAPTDKRFEKFTTLVLGGTPPDGAFVDKSVGFYREQGVLMDLEPLIEKAGGQAYKDKYSEFAVPGVADPETGHWYAIPVETQFWTLVINMDLADEVGIEFPEDRTWTWEEFMDAADKFNRDTDGDGKIDRYAYTNYGTGSPTSGANVVGHWMLANGGTWWGFNDVCTSVDLLTEENIEAFKHYVSLGINSYQPPGYVERGGSEHYRLIAEGVAAMAVTHLGGVGTATGMSDGTLGELRPMFLPGPGQKVALITEAWAIGAGAEHPEEGWEFLNWLNSDEKSLERMEVQGTLPATKTALARVKEEMPQNAFWVDLIDHSVSGCSQTHPRKLEYMQAQTDAITRVYQGEDPDVVLQELQEQLTDILAD